MGLILTLRAAAEDMFFNPHNRDGFSVYFVRFEAANLYQHIPKQIAIYEIHNYPDPQSGGVTIRYVHTGRSTYLPVRPRIFETLPEARRIRPDVVRIADSCQSLSNQSVNVFIA